MPVSPEEVARRLRAEQRSRHEEASARAVELRAKLGRAAAILRESGARGVWLFGSLAGGSEGVASDVDLAAEALPRDRYFDVLSALMALFETRVDLVRLEDAPESLRARILETGRAL